MQPNAAEADYEKLGVFYLGRHFDLGFQTLTDELCLYDSNDLVTHAVCIGMTGCGKTGMCLGLLEEAVIDGIPVIAIDPKGDIANLLLTFPSLSAAEFEPWVDSDQARRQSLSLAEFAEKQAQTWKDGLLEWQQSGDRIARLKNSADFAVYTPGSSAGLPISIMSSFSTPPQAVLDDGDAFADRVSSSVTSLLTLLGVEADPLTSKEHILLSQILQVSWRAGKDLSLEAIVQLIQKPPIAQVGALDLESFYSAKERFELSMKLNNLIASPGFEPWIHGEPLAIDRLLYTQEGKPRVSILSIAHLDDQKRMFFVSLLLNQLIAWMRGQSGTASLRAVFFMDEIFGYFPPTANPPSKKPLLTLMKQARAYGLGIVLASQNPVDIDYKGLANAGTWIIGRLQTERDKMRVLDGLEGAAADQSSGFNRAEIDKVLSKLGPRVFLMNNVHNNKEMVFQSRFTLSYLRGPITREQIKLLMKGKISQALQSSDKTSVQTKASDKVSSSDNKPLVPPGIVEHFLPLRQALPESARLVYRACLLAVGDVRFIDDKAKVDTTLQYTLLVSPPQMGRPSLDFDQSRPAKVWLEQLLERGENGAHYEPLPAGLSDAKLYGSWSKDFAAWLSAAKQLKLFLSEATLIYSKPRESERDFRVRLDQVSREKRDQAKKALYDKFLPKLDALEEKHNRAAQQLQSAQSAAYDGQVQTAISAGATVLGAFMGRKKISVRTIDKAASTARKAGRAMRDQQELEQKAETMQAIRDQAKELTAQVNAQMAELEKRFDPTTTALSEVVIQAKKTNISVPLLALVWAPYICCDGAADKPGWISLANT